MNEYYRNKNVLITGGLGFLGSNLAHRLVAMGSAITIVDNMHPLYGGNKHNLSGIEQKVKIVLGDVRDSQLMAKLVEGADIIFHFAAQVSYIDSLSMPYDDLDLNARSTLQLLELSIMLARKPKIVFSSSLRVL